MTDDYSNQSSISSNFATITGALEENKTNDKQKGSNFKCGPYKPNKNQRKMTANSSASDFQFASHGLSDTWIFWIDENITSLYN